MGTGLVGRAIEQAGERPIENLVHQCRLPGAADASDRDQNPERNSDVDVFQIVRACALDHNLAPSGRTTRSWRLDAAFAAEERAGERTMAVLEQVGRRALKDDVAAELPCSRPEVD